MSAQFFRTVVGADGHAAVTCLDCGQRYRLDAATAVDHAADGKPFQCEDCGAEGQL